MSHPITYWVQNEASLPESRFSRFNTGELAMLWAGLVKQKLLWEANPDMCPEDAIAWVDSLMAELHQTWQEQTSTTQQQKGEPAQPPPLNDL